MERQTSTALGLLEDAGYRVEVIEEFDKDRHQWRFHALAIADGGEYRIVSAASQPEAITELARQLGIQDASRPA